MLFHDFLYLDSTTEQKNKLTFQKKKKKKDGRILGLAGEGGGLFLLLIGREDNVYLLASWI